MFRTSVLLIIAVMGLLERAVFAQSEAEVPDASVPDSASADTSISASEIERVQRLEQAVQAAEVEQFHINKDIVSVEVQLRQQAVKDATPEKRAVSETLSPELFDLAGKYFVPHFQGGMAFGFSPEGKKTTQVGATPTFFGVGGGIGDYLIAEYLYQLYLDKLDATVSIRDRFVGVRVVLGLCTLRLRFGREDLGATYWSYLTGTIGDPRTLLRDGFGRSSESVMLGFSVAKYIQVRGAFNEATEFRAISANTHLGPAFFDIGHRTANDELGQISRVALGAKVLGFGLGVLCERRSELLTKTQVSAGEKAPLHNACVTQLGYTFKEFTLLYTEGWYLFDRKSRLGDQSWYRNLHLDYQVGQIKAVSGKPLATGIVFTSCGVAKNAPTLFGVSDLASPSRDVTYGFCEAGVRLKLGGFFDPLWPF